MHWTRNCLHNRSGEVPVGRQPGSRLEAQSPAGRRYRYALNGYRGSWELQ